MTTAARRADRPTTLLRNLRDAAHEAIAGGAQDGLDRAGFLLLLATVALTALPVVGLGPLPATAQAHALGAGSGLRIVEVFAFLTAALASLSQSHARALPTPAAPVAAFVGIVLLGALQILPLPERVLQSIAPMNAQVYHDARDTLAAYNAPGPSPRISLAASQTLGALLLLLACGAVCVAAVRLLQTRSRRRLFAAVVVLASIAGAAPAILPSLYARSAERGDLAAARLEIAMAVVFAAAWAEVLTGRSRMQRSLDPSERLERRILPVAFRLVLWLALIGLAASAGSSAGALAAGLTAVALPLVAMRHPRAHGRWPAAVVLALCGAAVAFAIWALQAAAPHEQNALSSASASASAPAAAVRRASVEAWKIFPVFGSGLGAFAEGFARTQPGTVPGRVAEPGRDALEALVTAGAVGTALAALLALSAIAVLTRAFLRQKHREESVYALAGAGAIFSLLVHGLGGSVLFDAAVALSLAAVLGASWAAGSERT